MLLQMLKHHTHQNHVRLEERVNILDTSSNLGSYQQLLVRFYGFYQPLEQCLLSFDWETQGWCLRERLKTGWLCQDLRFFGLDQPVLCQGLPKLPTIAHAVGALYVMEGATLGGQIIGRHLERNLGLSAGQGATFFNSYGDQVGSRWKAFREFAEGFAAEHEAVVAGAQDTFECLEHWLCTEVRS